MRTCAVPADNRCTSEAEWVAWMTGFQLTDGQQSSILSSSGDDVFYASVSSVSDTVIPESNQPWVAVNRRLSTISVVQAAGIEQTPVRSLWFNVAMLGLLFRGGLLIHGAGAVLNRRGFLLLGVSGAGKSTLSQLIEAAYPDSVLGDERIGVRPDGEAGADAWTMLGSPWESTAGIARQRVYPLTAIVFLEQATANAIQPIAIGKAMQRILPLISVDWKLAALADRGVQALDRLLAAKPAYVFRFTKTPDTARFLAEWSSRF